MKVTRWFPAVLQTIVEEVKSNSCESGTPTLESSTSIKEMLAKEATKTLEANRNIQIFATMRTSHDEIKTEMGKHFDSPAAPAEAHTTGDVGSVLGGIPHSMATCRSVRQKMRSTPITGGVLFDKMKISTPEDAVADDRGKTWHPFIDSVLGQSAELAVNGELFKIRVMPQTVQRIRYGYSGELLDDASVKLSPCPMVNYLEGFVRTCGIDRRTIHGNVSQTPSTYNGVVLDDRERRKTGNF